MEYIHKDGTYYKNVRIAINEEDHELMVVYEERSTDRIWIRPAKEFFDGRFMPFLTKRR